MKRIARVFPRITKMTPTDELVFTDAPPMFPLDVDEVHVSVAFTFDMQKAEWLARQWEGIGVPVKLGGPAFGKEFKRGPFTPGMYIKKGYTITSRGCPNSGSGNCWFCGVPEGVEELEIYDGWNVLDDNLLACSDDHVRKVFEMLSRQDRQPEFTGGLEAKILKPWHAKELRRIKTKRMYFAYDTPDDYEPLVQAGKILQEAGFKTSNHNMHCYVLIGYKGDTFEKAEKRLRATVDAGFVPYAMLYRDTDGQIDIQWNRFQREWLRPEIVIAKMLKIANQ